MGYCLALVLVALAGLVAAVAHSPRPNPRHEFILGMVARLAPGDAGSVGHAPSAKELEAA